MISSSNRKSKKFNILIAFLAIGLSYLVIQNIPASTNSNKITIYHTNDMHGAIESRYTPEGKLTQIGADVTKSLKDLTKNSIMIDAGDYTQGGMLASSSQGSKIIELMNSAGYDLATLGNHEFDYGIEALKLNSTLANFKMLAANVYQEEEVPILSNESNNGCNTIMEIEGKRLGFFGLTTCGTKYTTHPKNIEGLIFKNEIETAKQQHQYLKSKNVDMIILIAHIGTTDPDITTETIAREVPGIDIIIDGHSHEVYSKTVGHTFIQQVGTKSQNIGKIEIEFDSYGNHKIDHSIIKAEELINPLNHNIHQLIPDSKVSSSINDMLQKVSEAFRIIIGKTETGLYGGEYKKTRICRLQDTNLGNLIADALVYYGKTFVSKSGITQNLNLVSLQNGGGIRTSLFSKFISIGDVENVFPFPNKTSLKLVTAHQLYEILENGFKSIYLKDGILMGPDGAFPNVGGMRVEFDINAEPMEFNNDKTKILNPGARVKKIVLLNDDNTDKMELDRDNDETQIILITNNFETSGGDQYIMLKDLPTLTEDGDLLKDVLSNYIKFLTFSNGGAFTYPVTMSRVELLNSNEQFPSYDVNISVKENSEELKTENVLIQVDHNPPFTESTDERGNITVQNLDQGPHDIKISRENKKMSAYVNNRIGIDSADIFLENSSEQDISNIINIINGISHQKISDITKYVSFARNAYDSLTEDDKTLVNNYDILVNAEKAVLALNPDTISTADESRRNFKNHFYTVVTIIMIVSVTYITLHKIKSKKVCSTKGD